MNVFEINAGARARAPGTPGAIPAGLNAVNAPLNARRTPRKPKRPAAVGLSRDKVALVHIAKQAVGLDEDLYRAMLREVAGVASSKDLTMSGFLAVMQRFELLGFERSFSAKPRADLAPRSGMATPAQLDYIRALWAQWSGSADEGALMAWIEKRFHVSAIRFLDVTRAQKAIEGLKVMHARRAAQQLSPLDAASKE